VTLRANPSQPGCWRRFPGKGVTANGVTALSSFSLKKPTADRPPLTGNVKSAYDAERGYTIF
jgi:hypothetical protein